jgi:hypothetical protein
MGPEGFRVFERGFRRGGPRGALLARAEWLLESARASGRPPDRLDFAACYAEAGGADRAFALLEEAREALLLRIGIPTT